MNFFLPNFEDMVDPEYDFIADTYSPDRKRLGRLQHDQYAHQFFNEPIFDGMLVSKTVVNSKTEALIRQAGGVHHFYRLKENIPILGDCGAFSYVNEDVPPYDVSEIVGYYQDLGFSRGVALDHLVLPYMSTAERERRQTITFDNAESFLRHHQANSCTFAPVGIAQGWDAESRKEAVRKLVAMGYDYIALGGMARARGNKQIAETLTAISTVLKPETKFHVFGLARLSLIPDFVQFGVTSFDSASPIRRAFLGTGDDNFWSIDGQKYAAIRIPQAREKGNKRRGVDSTEEVMEKGGLTFEEMREMEQRALNAIRAFAQYEMGIEDALQIILAYDKIHGTNRDHEKSYRRTLSARPWENTECPICQQDGVEVIIFRGNNRNRRRGFHNVWAYYQRLQDILGDIEKVVV